MKTICVDACFLIALYDKKCNYHRQATDYFCQYINDIPNKLLVPWPILYEVVSTKLVKDKEGLGRLARDWKILRVKGNLELLNDLNYREQSLGECFDELGRESKHYRPLSLVDRVIRNVISSEKIDFLITFNQKDFVDVCKKSRCVMLY